MIYLGIVALALTWWGLAAAAASAVETTHIFGFTAGSDVGDDPEVEMENAARLGKRTGSYSGVLSTFEARFTPVKNLRLGPTLTFSRYDIAGVTGLSDVHQTAVHGASFKVKYRLLERDRAWFGLTLVAEPGWGRINDKSATRATRYGSGFAILLDRELVKDRLYGAFNVLYEAETSHERGLAEWEREAKLGLAASITHQFPTWMVCRYRDAVLPEVRRVGFSEFCWARGVQRPHVLCELAKPLVDVRRVERAAGGTRPGRCPGVRPGKFRPSPSLVPDRRRSLIIAIASHSVAWLFGQSIAQ
jgi:hypothetical protein